MFFSKCGAMENNLINNNLFEINSKVLYSENSLFNSINLIKKDYRKILIIIDSSLYKKTKYIHKFLAKLKKNKVKFFIFLYDSNFEPGYDYVDKKSSMLKRKLKSFDAIFACGGGSTLDFSKALAVTLKSKKKSRYFKGFSEAANSYPIIAAPTTVSTGSEAAYYAPLIDEKTKIKFGINIKSNTPKISILDPKLIVESDKKFVMLCALSSLVRSIESYYSKKSNYISKILSKISFDLIQKNIKKYDKNPKDLKAINRIQLGAYFSVLSLSNSGAGLAGSLSYHFSTKHNVPQSLGNALFGLNTIKINIANGFYKYSEIMDQIDTKSNSFKNKEKSLLLIKILEKYFKKYKVNLHKFNFKANFYDYYNNLPYISMKHFDNNPIILKEKELKKIFYSVV